MANKTQDIDNKIKIMCTCNRVRYFKDNFGIIDVVVDELEQGLIVGDFNSTITLKGTMTTPVIGVQYLVNADYVYDEKWGDQYNIISMVNALSLHVTDSVGQKKFLYSIFTPLQVDAMYEALDNPFQALENRDYPSLVKIKGCGLHRAHSWADKFAEHLGAARVYIELEQYNFTTNMINKLLRFFVSPDLVIEKVKTDPYSLMRVDGIGWTTADKIAIDGGADPYGLERVKAFMRYYSDLQANQGYSWITPDELLGAILDNLGEEVQDSTITTAIRELYEKGVLYYPEDKSTIGLASYYKLEDKIAKELIRLRNGANDFKYDNWQDAIKHLEQKQGWNYTEEQINGVQTVLENNVCIVYGLGGTGKTSVVGAMLETLKHYSFAQCALAGRASARMAEVTGQEGFTIHRLLGYPCTEDYGKDLFEYHEDRPLPYDIIIVDEISMVDAYLFYNLIRAIPTGSKLIMLGDDGQLESIGCGNIAHDIIHSPEIKQVHLTQIHRQAAASAIITESRKIRFGQQIVDKNWVGTETRGELQDLTITCYSDRSNTFHEVMKRTAKILAEDNNILDMQIIIPIKDRGQASTHIINNSVQELYNPASPSKQEVFVRYNGHVGILREGDKVINVQNNYKTHKPIYNGNIGIIKEIDPEGMYMVIDFLSLGLIEIKTKDFTNIELAYAITVHKSQGSEFENLIFAFDFNAYALLTREMVYTGITRAKKKCYVIAETGALRMATSKEGVSKKQTYLQQLLYDYAHPKLIF